MIYRLKVVQSHPTQFDAPVFRVLNQDPDVQLHVYYHDRCRVNSLVDPELGHSSGWGTDTLEGYEWSTYPPGLLSGLRFSSNVASSAYDLLIVSGYSSVNTLATAAIARTMGRNVGLRVDSTFLRRRSVNARWRVKDRVLPLLFRLYSFGHPTSSLSADYLQAYGFRKDQLFHFPYSIDLEPFATAASDHRADRSAIRAGLGIAPDDVVIIGIVKWVPREDPMTLLKGFASHSREVTSSHLILVGDGPLRELVLAFVRAHPSLRIHLPGYLPYHELPRYMAISDVLVHPAVEEPWGVTVAEAIACGLPVIAADTVGSAYDLVKDGYTGYTFRSACVSDLAAQLQRFSERRHDFQRNSCLFHKTLEQWSTRATAEHLKHALRSVDNDSDNRRK